MHIEYIHMDLWACILVGLGRLRCSQTHQILMTMIMLVLLLLVTVIATVIRLVVLIVV